MPIYSSPLREKTNVDAVGDRQRERLVHLKQPMSSPTRPLAASKRIRQQLEQNRQLQKEQRLGLRREKVQSDEDLQRRVAQLEQEARALEISLEQLLAEELDEDDEARYARELEEMLCEEEMELEAQLSSLQLGES